MSGSASGSVKFAVPAAAGSATYTWPAAAPASNKVLQSDNTGALSWVSFGTGDALTSNPLSQFAATTSAQLAGVLSDETGTGVAVFGTAPTFTTNLTSPMIIGGTGTTSTLTYKTTTGVGAAGADHIFQVGNNGATEAMRILNSGNVGIGTNNPTAKLNVWGQSASTNSAPDVGMYTSESTGDMVDGFGGAIKFTIQDNALTNNSIGSFKWYRDGADNSGSIAILGKNAGTFNANQFVIRSTGYVGIGTATPGEVLEVNGNVKATNFVSTSDRRLKDHIEIVPDGLDKILQLNGVSWQWKANGKPDMGVIAQDVEKVFPDAVVTNSDGMKAVKYNALIAPIIESIKEIFAQITGLGERVEKTESSVAKLNVENERLKAENAELKKRLDRIESRLGAGQ
jgi:hypothetical protein